MRCAGWVITRSCGRGSGERCRWKEFVCDLASAPRPCQRPRFATISRGSGRSWTYRRCRYPWAAVCERQFGCRPVQPFDERNLIVHVDDWEGDPGRRAMTVDELQAFFDFCDEQVRGRRALRRKGALAALRDCAMLKVCYAWGLRRAELVGLDVCDFHRNPRIAQFGEFGILRVRSNTYSSSGDPGSRTYCWPADTAASAWRPASWSRCRSRSSGRAGSAGRWASEKPSTSRSHPGGEGQPAVDDRPQRLRREGRLPATRERSRLREPRELSHHTLAARSARSRSAPSRPPAPPRLRPPRAVGVGRHAHAVSWFPPSHYPVMATYPSPSSTITPAAAST